MSESIDELALALDDLSIPHVPVDMPDGHANESRVPTGQRRCPICGGPMSPEACGPAVVDICVQHGMWLDNGELHGILDAARARATRRNRQAIKRARADGKVSGALFGVWSLAMD